jgi:hypothetical protein
VLDWGERDRPPFAHVLEETRALLAIRTAHLAAPRARERVRCEPAGPHAVWLAQPSAQGGQLVTFVDLAGTGTHRLPIAAGGLHVLHATRPDAPTPVVGDVRIEGDALVIEAGREAFGLVLHLPEGQ